MRLNKLCRFSRLMSLAASVLITITSWSVAASSPRIIVILDDVGYRHTDVNALSLPAAVTFSILPDTPLARELSEKAHAQGRDVMLHLPMEANNGNKLGPRGIKTGMYHDSIALTLEQALASVPYAIGVNNHMGSRLTREQHAMQALMSAISGKSLFFVDSRTTARSVAEQAARDNGVPVARRHVFIDHNPAPEAMQHEFERLVRLAKKQGVAIGIAHPHPATLSFLHAALASLEQRGVALEPISDYFDLPRLPPRQLAGAPKTSVAPN